MKTATIRLFWTPSVSNDVISQALKVYINAEIKVDISLPALASEYLVDVPEGSHANVTLSAFDGTYRSDEATLDFQVGDLTAPLPPTGLFYEVVSIKEDGTIVVEPIPGTNE
jgi:hypothetical protein